MDYSEIILELMRRIQILEKEVAELKNATLTTSAVHQMVPTNSPNENTPLDQELKTDARGKRDTTRYMFEKKAYLKNRLVLAVLQAYVRDNPDTTRGEIKKVFPRALQGSLGVVESAEIAQLRHDYEIRFFTKPEEVLHAFDGDMYVCTQWGILNIPNFVNCAIKLGYEIETI